MGAVKLTADLAYSHLWATQYPGGEATRVNTPPLKERTPDGRPRGLFFDVNNPSDSQRDSEATSSTRGTVTRDLPLQPRSRERGKSDLLHTKKRREWWDSPPKSMTPGFAAEKNQLRKAALFEFDVPEHLPTSPMCPAHPKNKSEGKGVCVVSLVCRD